MNSRRQCNAPQYHSAGSPVTKFNINQNGQQPGSFHYYDNPTGPTCFKDLTSRGSQSAYRQNSMIQTGMCSPQSLNENQFSSVHAGFPSGLSQADTTRQESSGYQSHQSRFDSGMSETDNYNQFRFDLKGKRPNSLFTSCSIDQSTHVSEHLSPNRQNSAESGISGFQYGYPQTSKSDIDLAGILSQIEMRGQCPSTASTLSTLPSPSSPPSSLSSSFSSRNDDGHLCASAEAYPCAPFKEPPSYEEHIQTHPMSPTILMSPGSDVAMYTLNNSPPVAMESGDTIPTASSSNLLDDIMECIQLDGRRQPSKTSPVKRKYSIPMPSFITGQTICCLFSIWMHTYHYSEPQKATVVIFTQTFIFSDMCAKHKVSFVIALVLLLDKDQVELMQ